MLHQKEEQSFFFRSRFDLSFIAMADIMHRFASSSGHKSALYDFST